MRKEDTEIADVFFNSMSHVWLHPNGCTLTLSKVVALPGQEAAPQQEPVTHIRTSMEHLKAMVYVLWRQLSGIQQEGGFVADVPDRMLGEMNISRQDWAQFWNEAVPAASSNGATAPQPPAETPVATSPVSPVQPSAPG